MSESAADILVTDADGGHWRWRPSFGSCCDNCGRPPGCGHTQSCLCPECECPGGDHYRGCPED